MITKEEFEKCYTQYKFVENIKSSFCDIKLNQNIDIRRIAKVLKTFELLRNIVIRALIKIWLLPLAIIKKGAIDGKLVENTRTVSLKNYYDF